ncbi:MAG TPA: DUF6600 domain-containing protein [Candidatus Dormibacteraeota bacterium]|nr:DUF6600 domain-containing protein [Candidatus Dormibacteraeota bacterium]
MKTGLIHRGKALKLAMALVGITLLAAAVSQVARAQDRDQGQDDPPSRVARLGHMEGSISFQPSGESEWVEAVRNRPMTTGDKLWSDHDSRAELQLGSSTIDLAPSTGFSFLNLDDHTVQIQLSTGTINVRVFDLDRDDVYEIDTPNQAFTVTEPGRYRIEASENGDYTVVTIREGKGESTGNGQSYTLHAGQRTTFSGTTSLNADVEQIGDPDPFDRWSYDRERHYQDSPSARYCSRQVVGFEDLDDNGDWRPAPEYGAVWYPRVEAGWAPYHQGHWAWIDPWGWTWVEDEHWGYAPFHYGRWLFIGGRWGWIPGPREVRPVYAPALVAFVGGVGVGVGGNVAWFPLGPREVYVPSYRVSPGYVNRVNVSNTTVNVTQVTNVYNTTIINQNMTINNVTYVNRNVRGAVTAVPQHAFATAQPVARTAVVMNQRQIAAASINVRAAVPPQREAVMGARVNTVNRIAAPPQAVASRAVIAKAAPPPPQASFAARQQVLQQHPGMPVARQEMERLRPANAPAAPIVRQAPPVRAAMPAPAANRPATAPVTPAANPPAANDRPGMNPAMARPQPGNPPAANNRPEPNRPEPTRPEPNRPSEPPARNDRPVSVQPNNQPSPQPVPNYRPGSIQPTPNQPAPNQPAPNYRPAPTQPSPNRPVEPPVRSDRPVAQPNNRPEPNQPAPYRRPEPNRTVPNQPAPNQPAPNQPAPNYRAEPARPQPSQPAPSQPRPNPPQSNRPPAPAPRPQTPPPAEHPQTHTAPPPQQQPAKPPKKDDKTKPQ